MYLDPLGRKTLERYRQWHRGTPTFWGVLFASPVVPIFVLIVMIAAAAGFVWDFHPVGMALIFGMMFGSLTHLISVSRIVPKIWPTVEQVIDWNKVDRLLPAEEDEGAADVVPMDEPAEITAEHIQEGTAPTRENLYQPPK